MPDLLDFENRPLIDALARIKRLAFAVITIEKLTLYFWKAFFWTLLFMGFWMLEVPQFFGIAGTVFCSILFVCGLVYLLIIKDIKLFSLPDKQAINQRLEQENKILSGTIIALDDKLANPKKYETRELWSVAQKQFLAKIYELKNFAPHAVIIKHDPNGLRFIAVLLFISGLFVSGPDWNNRIINGIWPFTENFSFAQNNSINFWVKPPEYTGMQQMHVTSSVSAERALKIPEGSDIKIRAYSPLGKLLAPSIYDGANKKEMKFIGDGLYGFDSKIAIGNKLAVWQFLVPRGIWNYTYIEDQPPSIWHHSSEASKNTKGSEEKNNIEILPNGQLRFALNVKDDYSVTDLDISIKLDQSIEDYPLGDNFSESKLVMSPPNTNFKIAPVYDLTWHTWAGLPVDITFTAKDHLGQTANLPIISVTLPERDFKNPVAKSIIAIRKKLAWSKDHEFTAMANDLSLLLKAKDFFNDRPVIYLAIKTASARLIESEVMKEEERIDTSKAIISLLWDTAIALEDGALALAMNDLKEAQKRLEQALRNPNSTPEEIQKLMDDLNEKIQSFFAELQNDIQKRIANGEKFPTISPDQYGQMISPNTLKSVLEQLQSEMNSGNKDKAQEMLSQLQRMMEMMDPSMSAPMPPDMQMMSDGVNELQQLIERQEKLLEQTKKQADLQNIFEKIPLPKEKFETKPDDDNTDSENAGSSSPFLSGKGKRDNPSNLTELDTSKNKAEQEALRYILGQIMMDAGDQLNEIPESMGKAEQDMRGSENELGISNPKKSVPHQESAIDNLKKSQENLSEMLQKRMQQMIGIGLSGGMRYDPLGRPYAQRKKDGPSGTENVKIPDEAQKKRAEEILRLLRERSGEFQRPQEELEYYRRLLRQF